MRHIGRGHLALVGRDFRPRALAPELALQRLRGVITAEYIEKMPDFVPLRQLAALCGIGEQELRLRLRAGSAQVYLRDGVHGVFPEECAEFLDDVRLLQLPLPEPEPVVPLELIGVSIEALRELSRRAQLEEATIPEYLDRLLDVDL